MNEDKNIDNVIAIAKEFKRLFLGLTTSEALSLAIEYQRNQILLSKLSNDPADRNLLALETLAPQLRATSSKSE